MSGEIPKIRELRFNGVKIFIESGLNGGTFDIKDRLVNPGGFKGDTNVHHLIRFRNAFEQLIGQHGWSEPEIPLDQRGIVVLEHHYPDAARPILNEISDLAKRVIKDESLYTNTAFGADYYALVKAGYDLLREHEMEFGLNHSGSIPVSLLRAGAVCTRAAFDKDKNARMEIELPVVTKRCHLKGENPSDLSVAITWTEYPLSNIHQQPIIIPDTVSPASGASELAFLLACAELKGVKPSVVETRSIMATRQGIETVRSYILKSGTVPLFYTLGECNELNESYYLVGTNQIGEPRIVADAGDALAMSLPSWYRQ